MLILLPVDGSELALDAVHHAVHLLSQGLKADFVLANVQEPAHLYEVMMTSNTAVIDAASEEAGSHLLVAAEALLAAAGATYQREIAHGDPAQMVLDIAERYGVDAIILGTRGAGTLRDALVGSVSQKVLHGATVPVTIVKHADQAAPVDDVASEA